jgi:hypothetical protein
MTQANQADLFGQGVYGQQAKPYDPNDEPNPNNPGGLSNNDMTKLVIRQRQQQRTSQQQSTTQGNNNATRWQRLARRDEQAFQEHKTRVSSAGQAGNDWLYPGIVAGTIAGGIAGGAIFGAAPGVAAAAAPTVGATAAPTLGAVGTVASPFPVAAASSAAGPAMFYPAAGATAATVAAEAAKAGMSLKDWMKAAGATLVGGKLVYDVANGAGPGGGGGGGGSAPAAAPTAGTPTTYGPSGGYIPPTVRPPGSSTGTSSAQQFASLSPAAQQSLNNANQFATQGAFQNVPTATGRNANQTAAVQRMFPNDQGQYNTSTQQGIQQQQNLANQFAQSNATATQGYNQQGAAAAGRQAPQIQAPSSANQMSVYNAAGSFQPNTSGVAGIRAATADVSGAGRLEGFQSTNSQQGVNALYSYNPDATYNSANQLGNFQAENTAAGANAVNAFRPDMVQRDAEDLRRFRADQSGINRLNSYAEEAQGPSAAQAMLRAQSDADKRTMLAIARSGRGGPAASVAAQRQAISEGGLISAETRGQGATLAAQETEAYKQRQLSALAQAGSLISQSEAQRLSAMSQAGVLMSQADAQKLDALKAYGQLKATQDSQQLAARQTSGQLNLGADQARLGAISNAAQVQSAMDAQQLSAQTSAANIRLQGSEINQRGQIAATNAELQGSAQQLQAMGLQAQIASDVRSQDISVLKSNLDASMQQLNLNDTQVRYFAGLGAQRDMASQAMQLQASQYGISAGQAQQALDLQYQQTVYSQLSQQQQLEYNYAALNSNNALGQGSQAIQIAGQQQNQNQFNTQQQNRQSDQWWSGLGGLLEGIGKL